MIKLTPGEMSAAAWVNVTDARDNPGRRPLFWFVPGGVAVPDADDAQFVILPMLEIDKRREIGERVAPGGTSWAEWRPYKFLAQKVRRALDMEDLT